MTGGCSERGSMRMTFPEYELENPCAPPAGGSVTWARSAPPIAVGGF